MSQSPKPRGLGRGLSALLGDEEVAATVSAPQPSAPDSSAREKASSTAPNRPPLTLPIGRVSGGRLGVWLLGASGGDGATVATISSSPSRASTVEVASSTMFIRHALPPRV